MLQVSSRRAVIQRSRHLRCRHAYVPRIQPGLDPGPAARWGVWRGDLMLLSW